MPPEVHLPALDEEPGPEVAAPRPTKSFFKIGLEIVLISMGVFLGLVGEGWRERAEHRELAEASLRRFRAEFQANKAEVDRVAYFGDASIYEELLLKQYDALFSRLDKAIGD